MRHETRYRAGELIVVEATISGPRATAQARMLVDTGALMTTITPEVIELCGYTIRDATRTTWVRSAVAEEQGYELRLEGLAALGATVEAHLVNVFDLGHDDIVDGLLGINFLNHFDFEVLPADGRILAELRR